MQVLVINYKGLTAKMYTAKEPTFVRLDKPSCSPTTLPSFGSIPTSEKCIKSR